MHKVLPSTTSYYKACTTYFPVLLRTTKLAQRTSQYYFVLQSLHNVLCSINLALQSLHKVLPGTSSYYKACTKYFPVLTSFYKACTTYFPVLLRTTSYYKACKKYFPVLLRTTRLAQRTSQYYFVLQSLHKVLPSTTSYYFVLQSLHKVQYYFVLQSLHNVLPTTSYYKACTKYFPVLLRTTKLAQRTSLYYFALQSLHNVLPSTTSYCKACTKYFPVAPSNLDAAITLPSAQTQLQSTVELRAKASKIAAPKPDLDAKAKKHEFEALFTKSYRQCQNWQNLLRNCYRKPWCSHSITIYDIQLQKTLLLTITHAAMAPSNLHAAMTMRFATSVCKPASLDAYGSTKRQQSCSHYTAICNQRVKKRKELRAHEQPFVAERRGGTDRAWFDRSRTRRTQEVPFIAGRSHFTRKNTRFPAPAFSQNGAHATSMQPLQCVHHPSWIIVSHFSLSTLHWILSHTSHCCVM